MKKDINVPDCSSCKNKDNFFCNLSINEKKRLGLNKKSGIYKKGEVIFNEGGLSNRLYCIFNGKVKITKLGTEGKDQLIRFSKTADILGYRALFNSEPYNATATAIEETTVCFLPKTNIMEALTSNTDLALRLVQLLSSNLRDAENHIIEMGQRTATERLILALLLLHETFGFAEDGKTINVKLSRRELADMAGISGETAIRLLIKLKERKLIELEKKNILIPNLRKLQNEVE